MQTQNQYYQVPGVAPVTSYSAYGQNLVPQQKPRNVQFLTKEEIAELQKRPQSFQSKLTREEYLRSICTHKDPDGQFKIDEINDGTGRGRCAICGEEWNMIDLNASDEEVASICSNFYDLFQTIKTYYGDVPVGLKEIYIISGFISKVPQLWKIAKKYFENSAGYNQLNPQVQDSDQMGFRMLGNIFGGLGMQASVPGMNVYGGSVNPYYAMNNQFNAVPPMGQFNTANQQVVPPVVPQQYVVPNQGQNQFAATSTPVYGMGNAVQQPAPQPMQNNNPIGYVDNTQDFTQTVQQNVVMPGPEVNAQTQTAPPMPEAPKNPNLQDAKATVNKTFVG